MIIPCYVRAMSSCGTIYNFQGVNDEIDSYTMTTQRPTDDLWSWKDGRVAPTK